MTNNDTNYGKNTELALISTNPATFIFQHFSVNVDQVSSHELEDDLNFLAKWKTTSIYSKMEDDLFQ